MGASRDERAHTAALGGHSVGCLGGARLTRGSSGQATIEHVGITLVIALLLGALAMWATSTPWSPDTPTPVIEQVAAQITGAGTGSLAAVSGAADRMALPRRAMERPVAGRQGRVLRRAWDGFL